MGPIFQIFSPFTQFIISMKCYIDNCILMSACVPMCMHVCARVCMWSCLCSLLCTCVQAGSPPASEMAPSGAFAISGSSLHSSLTFSPREWALSGMGSLLLGKTHEIGASPQPHICGPKPQMLGNQRLPQTFGKNLKLVQPTLHPPMVLWVPAETRTVVTVDVNDRAA